MNISDECFCSVVLLEHVRNASTPLTVDETVEAEEVALKSSDVQSFLKKYYGIDRNSLHLVRCEPWTVGYQGFERERTHRLANCFMFTHANDSNDYMYAHPIEGIVPIVDLDAMQIFDIEVYEDYMPKHIPMNEYNYTTERLGAEYYNHSAQLKPLEIVQPEGPSFSFDGNVIRWHKWTLHIGFSPREGMVLSDIHFEGRKILHRLSLAEMVVPYGAAYPPHNRKHAIDVSEYNFGSLLMPQTLGSCCLGHIAYLDAVTVHTDGSPARCKNAICIHEQDDGILWKQVNWHTNHTETRRRRVLAISSYAQILNYGYRPEVDFGPDGKIHFHIQHTGVSIHDMYLYRACRGLSFQSLLQQSLQCRIADGWCREREQLRYRSCAWLAGAPPSTCAVLMTTRFRHIFIRSARLLTLLLIDLHAVV